MVRWDVEVVAPDAIDLPTPLAEVYGYWDRLRQDRWAPRWSEFALTGLSSPVIPFTLVVDVRHDPLDFVYRFWGTANTTFIGYDCTGLSVRDNPRFSDKVFDECRQVYDSRKPLVFRSRLARADGSMARDYLRLRAPLSEDGETMTHMVSVLAASEKLTEVFEPKRF